jgi:hypothetical protein
MHANPPEKQEKEAGPKGGRIGLQKPPQNPGAGIQNMHHSCSNNSSKLTALPCSQGKLHGPQKQQKQ